MRPLLCMALLAVDVMARANEPTPAADCANSRRPDVTELRRVIEATYGNGPDVYVEALAQEGCESHMLESLSLVDARLRFSDPRVGYALFRVDRERVLEVLDLPGVAELDVPTMWNQDRRTRSLGFVASAEREIQPLPAIAIAFPRVATTLAADGPFFAASEAGLTQLWQRHPEADGRGVTVAVVDNGVDYLHPELQLARDAGGRLVAKVADIVPVDSPEDPNPNWVLFGAPVKTEHRTFSAAGKTWKVARDGLYRFGIYARDMHLGGYTGDSRAPHLKIGVGVLWDEQDGLVWVDTDADQDFANNRPLGDYARTHELGYFGLGGSAGDNRIPFGVRIDAIRRAAYLSISLDPHGTLVSGPLAGNRLSGGLFDGAAPGARLVDVHAGVSRLTSILYSFGQTQADIINVSGAVATPGSTFQRHVLERAIQVYDKPMACLCSIEGALGVGDHQSAAMLRRNRQTPPPYRDTIHGVTASIFEDTPENTVFAPSTSLGTLSRYMPESYLKADGLLYLNGTVLEPPAPAGYVMTANPSPTIPVASGVLADLISAARHANIRYNAFRLVQAVLTATEFRPQFPGSQQSHGLLNAAAAFAQLEKMAAADDPGSAQLTSFEISRTINSASIPVHGFKEDLAHDVAPYTGTLWITRKGGYAGGRRFRFAIRGNDGTYRLLTHSATLLRDQPAPVEFQISPLAGLHQAFLKLIDGRAGTVMQEVPLAVRVPEHPNKVTADVEEYDARIPPRRADIRYIRLPANVQAARYTMRIPGDGGSPLSVAYIFPGFQRYIDWDVPPATAAANSPHHIGPMQQFESLVRADTMKTQPVYWGNRGLPEYETPYDAPAPDVAIDATLTVARYAVKLEQSSQRQIRITNELAELEGSVEFYNATTRSKALIGAGRHATVSEAQTLPTGIEQWRIQLDPEAGLAGDLDVFLLNCTLAGICQTAATGTLRSPDAELIIDSPAPGPWRIVARRRNMAPGTVNYQLRQTLLTPSTEGSIASNHHYASGATELLTIPATAAFAAFRIVGTPGIDAEKAGVRVAMTALETTPH